MSLPEKLSPSSNGAPSPDWMDARVEAYVDGALSPDEETIFEARLQAAPRWKQAVRRARRVRSGLRGLPQPVCPPEVTQAALREACASDAPPRNDRAARPLAPRRASDTQRARQASLALVFLLLLAAGGALLGRPAPTDAPSSFTHAEVQQATAQAEWTLAFLAHVARQTGTTVQEDVLEARVAAPVQEAVGSALDDSTTGNASARFRTP